MQRQVATSLGCANAPGSWWSLAGEMCCYNDERTKTVRDTGKTRYELRRGVPWTGTLYPFGCGCSYVVPPEERDKFEAAHKPTKADHLKEGKDEYGKMGRRSRRSTVSIHHPSSIIAHHPDPLSHNPFPSPTSLLSHTTAKRKKGANGRVATTQGQTPQITERRTTSEPSMDLQVQTLSEVEEKQWRHGRKHTHDALTTAKSDYASRAGEDGTVGATQIDERLQTAHFAQPVGKPRPKFLTVRRKYMHNKIICL